MNDLGKHFNDHIMRSCKALKRAMDADEHSTEDYGDSVDAPLAGIESTTAGIESTTAANKLPSSNCSAINKIENTTYNRQMRTSGSGSLRCANATACLTVEQGTNLQESVVDLVRIKEEAVKLGHDVVKYMSSRGATEVPITDDVHAKTLRRTVDNLSERHEIPFASMTKKLRIGEPGTNCQSIVSIANEMFADGQYNWGRVITLYAFAGWLAKYCAENNIEGNWIEKIGETVGSYVANHLSDWIASQGGWDDMDRFFPPEENVESKIWRGLVYTMLGLGALATTVAAVR